MIDVKIKKGSGDVKHLEIYNIGENVLICKIYVDLQIETTANVFYIEYFEKILTIAKNFNTFYTNVPN